MPRVVSKKKAKVLMLDDDPIISGFYREVLEERGCNVTLVHRVSDLMNTLERDPAWDAVILDIMMPHGDWQEHTYAETDDGLLTGVFVAQTLKKQLPELPKIILTNRVPKAVSGHLEGVVNHNDIKSKLDFPPFEFADFLQQRLAGKSDE